MLILPAEPLSLESRKGYKNVVVHEPLPQILHDGVFVDLRQENHVIHPALLDVLHLPVVPLFAALGGEEEEEGFRVGFSPSPPLEWDRASPWEPRKEMMAPFKKSILLKSENPRGLKCVCCTAPQVTFVFRTWWGR